MTQSAAAEPRLAGSVIARGREVSAANLWVSGRRVARAVFGPMGKGISPYPYAFIFPQDEHERLLIDRVSDAGVRVERETEFVGLEERDDRIIARLERAGGRIDFCEAAFVAGCDGVFDVSRASSGRRPLPQRTRVPPRRCGTRP